MTALLNLLLFALVALAPVAVLAASKRLFRRLGIGDGPPADPNEPDLRGPWSPPS